MAGQPPPLHGPQRYPKGALAYRLLSLQGKKCPQTDSLPSQKGKIPSSALPAAGFQGNFTGDHKFIKIFGSFPWLSFYKTWLGTQLVMAFTEIPKLSSVTISGIIVFP